MDRKIFVYPAPYDAGYVFRFSRAMSIISFDDGITGISQPIRARIRTDSVS